MNVPSSKLKSSIARLVNILFPELEALVLSLHMASVYALLEEFLGSPFIASCLLTHLKKILDHTSRGRYSRDKAMEIRDDAHNFIGTSMAAKSMELKHTIQLIRLLSEEISEIEASIKKYMDTSKSPIMSIPGISYRMGAITLNLYSDTEGYKNVAELLADANKFPGIDIARFGDSISIILKRVILEHESVLYELDKAVDIYRDYYQYEEIQGMNRVKVETIPEEAFRETVANALVHRTWDVNAQIRVMMFDDRIEVTSPGGLPSGLSEEEYLKGNVSILRNPILGNVFFRLHIVEILGTGIVRIKEAYKDSKKKLSFEVFENSIKVVLPVISNVDLTDDEAAVYNVLSKTQPKSSSEVTEMVPFGKSKTTGLLKEMAEKNIISIVGNGRGTKYKL